MSFTPMDFDCQADSFDRRAGIPAQACGQIARAVVQLARPTPGDLCLEIGPGTGQIGRFFDPALRYLGLDNSLAMLQQFRRHASGQRAVQLLQADANCHWPLADSCARIIFASRVSHLLDGEHLLAQVARVAGGRGACLLIGAVHRDPDAPQGQLRRQMQRLLSRHGFDPLSKAAAHETILKSACGVGASLVEPLAAACWMATSSPAGCIERWRNKPGLAGLDLPPAVQHEVLAELQHWAQSRFGELDRAAQAEEVYWLQGVRFG